MSTIATTYSAIDAKSTARKPYAIDTIVVKVDPITEEKPLIAHPHATYSPLYSLRDATSVMVKGMNMPRQKPRGAHSATTTTALARVGQLCRACVNEGAAS